MTVLEKLIAIAQEEGPAEVCRVSATDVVGKLEAPNFTPRKFVMDWERYIPKALQDVWKELPPEAKLAAVLVAEQAAAAEDWD